MFIYNCYLLGQLQHNRGSLPVVDVVVDPHLSSHLRPHQREGVQFLYECAMGLRDFSGNGAILAYVVTTIITSTASSILNSVVPRRVVW